MRWPPTRLSFFRCAIAVLATIVATHTPGCAREQLRSGSQHDSHVARAKRPDCGAIRWDGWDPQSTAGKAVCLSLTPERWRWRLPFFAAILPDGKVELPGYTPQIMAREIGFARAARLDYWAFVAYPPEDPMSLGLRRYLESPHRDQIKFCMISEVQRWHPADAATHAARFADLMKLPNYQKVSAGRPLFFFLNLDPEALGQVWQSTEGFKAAVDALRSAARERGLGDPYVAVMMSTPPSAKAFAAATGCDAISAYACQAGAKHAPYRELAQWAETSWETSKATGARVIPLAMTGWDRRPRVETPVPWERNEGWAADADRYYETAKPDELAAHVQHAAAWSEANRETVDSNAIIIYAWNEHDEGGWICPTLGEGDARVQALRVALGHR